MNSSTRANFLPNQQFVQLRPILQDHLTKIANAITPSNFVSICDRVALQLLQNSFEQVRASEGSIWLLDSARHSEARNLVVAYNTGPNARKIQGFKQPLNKGIVSLTLATEQAFVENNVPHICPEIRLKSDYRGGMAIYKPARSLYKPVKM